VKRFFLGAALILLFLTGCSRHTTRAAGRRMIVLGIDGMDPQFVEAHWDVLPNLKRLRDTGDFHTLATTVPPQSPVAWSTVTTGMDPGGHGLYDFVHRDPKTRMPLDSMSQSEPAKFSLPLGPYLLPLSGGSLKLTRAGQSFWKILGAHGVPSDVIRMPANFPPEECEAETLSGMGTEDLQGTAGTFTFFTDDPAEQRKTVAGGKVVHVNIENGGVGLSLDGPSNPFRRDGATATSQFMAHVDPVNPAVRFDVGDEQVILKQGEWSDWIPVTFPLLPVLKSAHGMIRIYLQQVHPHLRIYVSPVDIDPEDPELPISTPSGFSRELAEAVGRFYTHGIPEETSAYRADIFNRAEFLRQSHEVLDDSLKLYRHELDHFTDGLLFYYFSSVDQNSHMLWGKDDADLLPVYEAMDEAVGEAMKKAGDQIPLMVISDHGFARFDRAVNLNTWLMHEGFLTLDDPANVGDEELFAHVDWSQTKAYAIGLNGLYLNMAGREDGGIVTADEKQALLEKLKAGLLAFHDPDNGHPVVGQVYFPETLFRGHNLKYAPDIIVGYHRGYRASWQTALGAVPKVLVEDNTAAWVADHCMAADEVPGVVFCNRKIRKTDPGLQDVAPTILEQFGVAPTSVMIGHPIF